MWSGFCRVMTAALRGSGWLWVSATTTRQSAPSGRRVSLSRARVSFFFRVAATRTRSHLRAFYAGGNRSFRPFGEERSRVCASPSDERVRGGRGEHRTEDQIEERHARDAASE